MARCYLMGHRRHCWTDSETNEVTHSEGHAAIWSEFFRYVLTRTATLHISSVKDSHPLIRLCILCPWQCVGLIFERSSSPHLVYPRGLLPLDVSTYQVVPEILFPDCVLVTSWYKLYGLHCRTTKLDCWRIGFSSLINTTMPVKYPSAATYLACHLSNCSSLVLLTIATEDPLECNMCLNYNTLSWVSVTDRACKWIS